MSAPALISEFLSNFLGTSPLAGPKIRSVSITNTTMAMESERSTAIQGQILRRSERREAAIYPRDGVLWVADFVDGHGQLVDAATWLRFNCGGTSSTQARWRMALESASPLCEELAERIEALHRTVGN